MDIFNRLQKVKLYSPYQFSFFRIIFGIYLFIHFLHLYFWSDELFSSSGLLTARMNPGFGIFPGLLFLMDDPLSVKFILGGLIFLSLLFAAGTARQVVSILLWFGWASLFHRNILISNPGIPFVGWLLLASALVPAGEPFSLFTKRNKNWYMPFLLFWGAWLLMAAGYTVSGIHKMGSPSWMNGSALMHLLHNPLARDTALRIILLDAPDIFLRIMTWTSLFLEVSFLPFVLLRKTRLIAWLGITCMHAGILTVVSFADLTAGVLMLHLFTFDSAWMGMRKLKEGEKNPVIFFDGVCVLCSGAVDFLLAEERENLFRYAPLQGYAAKEILSGSGKLPDSIIYYDNGKIYTKMKAVIRIAVDMGGIWRLAVILTIVPEYFGNIVYDLIAKNRYRWFGKKETCRIPGSEEKNKFLS